MTELALDVMRVAHKMESAQFGRWRLKHFTQTEDMADRDRAKIQTTEISERATLALARVVPPGDYVSLQRRMIDQEVRDYVDSEVGDINRLAGANGMTPEQMMNRVFPVERRWMPVMSDTPAELREHRAAMTFDGAVLVTGLGLGCVVSGLLAKADVTRIDVIEIDSDVINLTGRYYVDDPRVKIWNVSATDIDALPADLHWDFAWHDIWTSIAERNLRDDTAEHGISYGHLFDLWSDRVTDQHAWAYDDALAMRAVNDDLRAKNIDWYERLLAADEDTQVRMLQDKVILEEHPDLDGRIDDHVRAVFDPSGELREHLRNQIRHNAKFLSGMRRIAEQDLNGGEPLGRPNEEVSQ